MDTVPATSVEACGQLQSILDTMLDGVIVITEAGVIEMVNAAAERLFGYAAVDLTGRDVAMLMAEPHRSAHDGHLARYQATGERRVVGIGQVVEGRRRDGTTFPMELGIGETCIAGRRLFTGILRDLTPKQAIEAELALTRKRLLFALEASNDGIWDWDVASGQVHNSRRWAEMLGYEPEELLVDGSFWATRVHPDDRDGIDAVIASLLAGAIPAFEFEYRVRAKDGRWIWVFDRGKVVERDASGRPSRVVGVQTDVTERMQREQELERVREALAVQAAVLRERVGELERLRDELTVARAEAEAAALAKGRFLAQMSHEIRTPMTAVLGFAGLLQSSILNEEQQQQVATILKTGRELLAILNDVLDFSKLEAGRLEIVREPFRLAPLLENLRPLTAMLLAEKAVNVELLIDPALPTTVIGDAARLRQVLTNLLGNAAKFTDKGHVRLEARPAAGAGATPRVRFAVIDTGPGIAPEQLGRLFQSFQQLDSTRGRHGGTGLGLAISKQLVERMGGRIGVDSLPGQGSTFWFELPLEPTRDDVAEAAAATTTGPLRPLRVLVADDVATNRQLLRALLRRGGHEVRLAVNGLDALSLVESDPPDLVLMDVSMPELDGMEATRRIRALDGSVARVPIVALTAHAFATDVEACLAAGMDAHLAKPIEPAALHAVLARIAAGHR
jgi:two-component system sensor histidine kinase/response regulator